MTEFLNWLNGEIIWGPPLIALIIITGIYVTVRSGFFQVCHLGYIFKRTLGCILRKDHVTDENDKGLLSHLNSRRRFCGLWQYCRRGHSCYHRRAWSRALDVADSLHGHVN